MRTSGAAEAAAPLGRIGLCLVDDPEIEGRSAKELAAMGTATTARAPGSSSAAPDGA
jgi:hypothetical protein